MIASALRQKPKALGPGSRFAPIAPASPAKPERILAGKRELERLGFRVAPERGRSPRGYFTGSPEERRNEFLEALGDPAIDALVATRGGYGSAYLLDESLPGVLPSLKPIVGYSDLSTLQIYLWQKHRWPTFYGPMLAAGLDAGADTAAGYESASFRNALMNPDGGWQTALAGETLRAGSAEGILLGGAMTLVEATLATPWELDTSGAILVLEDRGMKPYQVDRVLLHLKHAGKLKNVSAIVLGDFPDCEPPVPGSPTVREVAQRILAPLDVPVVFGAPVGHTPRPMLTLPLGAPARLVAEGQGTLKILEPSIRP
ncbi:MAG TPA: LD-carboxypeptidase [Candidatus Acidoferrum sp.]|nr:LD-carboxypeptidase [Candidatus Acidoferrum sp.]